MYINPSKIDGIMKIEWGGLILVALIIGSFIYAIHRAIFYPIILRFNLAFVFIYNSKAKKLLGTEVTNFYTNEKRIGYDNFLNYEIRYMDFRRWNERDNKKSFSKNILDWSAQIHFLYCCVWACLSARIISVSTETIKIKDSVWVQHWYWIVLILLVVALFNHYRSLLYDLSVVYFDTKYENDKKEEKNELDSIEIKMK